MSASFNKYSRRMVYEKIRNPAPPLKYPCLVKKEQEEQNIIKGNLKEAYDHWHNWKLQIHQKKMKWVVPNKRNTK